MARYASLQYEKDFGDVYSLLEGMENDLEDEALGEFAATDIFPWLRERALNRFPTHGDEATGKWPALRTSTQERRRRMGYGGPDPINIRTGELEEYIAGASPDIILSGGAVLMIYPGEIPEDPITERKYATAQRGRNDKTRTPPRPIIAVSPEDYAFVRDRLFAYITRRG